jgi:putative hemolysin
MGADRAGYDQTGIHELNAAISLARTSRLISASEEKILTAASQLSHKTIKSIMTPLEDTSMMADSNSLTEALIQAHNDMHTRFPVYDNQQEKGRKILGYVNFKDIVATLKINPQNPTVKGIIRPIQEFDENLVVAVVLEKLIKDKAHLAMITGKDNLPIGMVTLEDIIEELVGDIEDEYDRQPNYIHQFDAGWIMGGGVTMGTLAEKTGLAQKRPEFINSPMRLSEWCETKTGKLDGGEVIVDGNLHVVVRKLRRHKVGEAIVSVASFSN